MIFQDVVVHASASSVTASTRALSAYRFPVICAFNLIYVHVHRLRVRVRVRVSGDLETRPNLFFHHTGRFLMRLQSGKLEIWWSEQTNQCTVGSWTPEWYRRPLKSGICGYKNRHSFVDFVAFSPHQFFGRWKENCSFKDQYVLVTDGRALRSPAVQGIDYHESQTLFCL